MNVAFPKPGVYVLAVSGGVDSMALLDVLSKRPELKLVVAHFDHGIREDSAADCQFVRRAAEAHDLKFVSKEGRLGSAAAEATARVARYDFLRQVMKAEAATAIITAHHQDDMLETAILNLLRGTGRKGLTALKNQPDIVRPLLKASKAQLITYARQNSLAWREDPTNADTLYLRNYIRHAILPRFKQADKARFINILTDLSVTNQVLDDELAAVLRGRVRQDQVDRQWFNSLPHAAAREVLAAWLRSRGSAGFDRKTLERLVVAAKTAAAGKSFPVQKGLWLIVEADSLRLDDSQKSPQAL